MTEDEKFNRKMDDTIKAYGPSCSCLVTIVLLGLACLFMLDSCR